MKPKNRGPLPERCWQMEPQNVPANHPLRETIKAEHAAAMKRGEPMYLDPMSGFWVQTAESIWKSRDCCELDCRHCPFRDGEPLK